MAELLRKLREKVRDKGVAYMLFVSAPRWIFSRLTMYPALAWCRLFRGREKFSFRGAEYPYLFRRYNLSYRNERAVEVPIVWELVRRESTARILEVGNVLSHYYPTRHDVLDKYEDVPGILRCDVVDFRPEQPYDLIVAISTLEHVGWDWNEERDPDKAVRAVHHLIDACLKPGGRLVVTIPVGANPGLDRAIDEGRIRFSEKGCLKRVSWSNRWAEAAWDTVRVARYDWPYNHANAIVVGDILKPA